MKITISRVFMFISLLVAVGLILQQCWQSKPEGEKWLYFFEDAAREYAGLVLGVGRGTDVPVPEALAHNHIVVHENYVSFSPKQNPKLILAFCPAGAPGPNLDGKWVLLRDAWYVLNRR